MQCGKKGSSYSITSSARADKLGETVRPRRLQVKHKAELGGLHDRQVARLLALEDASGVDAGLAIRVRNAGGR